ncbi:hypothetical protein [Cohnella sp. JJ-181]|uniref:hypothetical protein n=1 Tax=Cohnella rhizoplanae TaxID=2974897 RepID=UPI0022FF6B0A|nr:hypothetical protein [Cohnella sp. JJ-181]CAI6063057.1 hypothetical protein COHCIP112018_01961 [Cohnella sp. JJ-181]
MGKDRAKRFIWILPLVIWVFTLIESLFVNAINGSVYKHLAWFFGGPAHYWASLHPKSDKSPEDIQYLFFITLSLLLIGLWLFGCGFAIQFILGKIGWIRERDRYPSLIANDELASALNHIQFDRPRITGNELVRVKRWMDEYVNGIARIFSLEKRTYRAYWLIGSQGMNNDEYIAVRDIDVPDLSGPDTQIIRKALNDNTLQNYQDTIDPHRYPHYSVKSYFFVRDERFNLAFIIFIEKEDVVNKRTLREFEFATSNFYILGSLDKLLKIMLESIKDQ